MEFKQYESKPVVRLAFQITKQHEITKINDSEAAYYIERDHISSSSRIYFKAYERPVVGDWIVYLTDADTYHCTDAVFRERNIVYSHTLYTDADKDKPEQICDSSGQVVLAQCKWCKRAEAELVDVCDVQ